MMKEALCMMEEALCMKKEALSAAQRAASEAASERDGLSQQLKETKEEIKKQTAETPSQVCITLSFAGASCLVCTLHDCGLLLQAPLGGLCEAIASGSWARAQELIASGADVNTRDPDVGVL
jgi:hypothetical protein